MKSKRDKLLGVACIITFVIGAMNAFEYFLAGKNYLFKKTAVVRKIEYERYENRKGILYSKTTIRLEGVKGGFYINDKADDGGYFEVNEGDTVTVYARKYLQVLYNYDYRSNLYYLEKNGELVYNNLLQWKGPAFSYMCVFLGCSFFLLIMYLDQVKNISISNWYQKRFLKKKDEL